MLLAGDIGGTKTALALIDAARGERAPVAQSTFPSAEYASLEALAAEFLAQAPERVVGILATRASLEFRGGEREQTRAWQSQVPLLRAALAKVPGSGVWGLVLEYSLRRLGLRPDAVLLAPGVIIALEFKMGSVERRPQDSRQAENYALCIRDFHASARGFDVAQPQSRARLSSPSTDDLRKFSIAADATRALPVRQCCTNAGVKSRAPAATKPASPGRA